jgi:TPR repeat protein
VARGASDDQVGELIKAAGAGDPRAMFDYALTLVGLAEAHPGFPGNALPFLTQVADDVAGAGSPHAHDLIDGAAQGGYPPAMVVEAIWVTHSDRPVAISLLDQAASQGYPAAMLSLGMLLAPDDPQTAKTWLTKLADTGDDMGMYALSNLLRTEDPLGCDAWLRQAAAAGNVRAQSDLAVLAFEHGQPLDRRHPPAVDPRATGVLKANTPVSRQARQVADCVKCGRKTVQDIYEFITGRWFGMRGPTTAGKSGTRLHFSACTVCGCLFPVDPPSRQYVAAKGGEFFNPAKLHQSARA